MPPRSDTRVQLPARWRVGGLLLVVLAVGLAGTGTLVALHQIRTLTNRTVDQAAAWARLASRQARDDGDDPTTAFRPTHVFIEQQKKTEMVAMVVYGGLTAAALATLLFAMWLLLRLVRREMALAELKANFVADVSHELKTPLALISLFAETLQSGRVSSDEKRNEYYSVILRESTRLTNLINNILDFSRIDADRKEYVLQPTNVAQVVCETFDAYRPQLDHEGFEHHLTVDDVLPPVDADRDAIAQIVVNLLNNTIKYSGEEKYVAIELTRDTRRGRRGVLLSVHDRGIGIRPEDRAHLTEGFFRAGDARVREQGGTGLGLALVKNIVDAHHGSLDIETRLVKGSTFRVFLPASVEPALPKSGPELSS
jgi:signal transduction histidine kinase